MGERNSEIKEILKKKVRVLIEKGASFPKDFDFAAQRKPSNCRTAFLPENKSPEVNVLESPQTIKVKLQHTNDMLEQTFFESFNCFFDFLYSSGEFVFPNELFPAGGSSFVNHN